MLNRMEHLNLEQFQFLIIIANLLVPAFLIAFYNDTGLTALIRDLLEKNSYRSTQIVAYGRMYFKSAFTSRVVLPHCWFCGYYDFSCTILLYQMMASSILAWIVIAIYVGYLLLIYTNVFYHLG